MKEVQKDLNLGDIFNNFQLLMEPWMIWDLDVRLLGGRFCWNLAVFKWKSYGGCSGLRAWFGFDCGGFGEFW